MMIQIDYNEHEEGRVDKWLGVMKFISSKQVKEEPGQSFQS